MATKNAIEYLNEKNKTSAWICGDSNSQSCGLNRKLTDLGCGSCFYKAGQMGKETISEEAEIHYNPNWPNSDFVKKEKLEKKVK